MAVITAHRARRSITTLDTDTGVYGLTSLHVPLHYESTLDSGNYDTAIDCTPVRVDVPAFDGWRVEVNGWHYALGQPEGWGDGTNGFGGRRGEHWFKSRLVRIGAVHWPTRTWLDAGGAPTYNRANLSTETSSVTAGGETFAAGLHVHWSDIWQTANGGAVNAHWRITGDRFKEEIEVDELGRAALGAWLTNQLTARPNISPADVYLSLVFKVDWSDIPALVHDGVPIDPSGFTEQAPYQLKNAAGELLAYMPIDRLIVRGADGETSTPLYRRLWRENGDYYLLIGVSLPVLNAMPAGALIFDPTIDTDIDTGYDDAYQQGGGTTYASETITYIRCSTNTTDNNWRAGGMRFALAGLPQGATITTAYVTGNVISDYDDPQCVIYCEDIDSAANYNTNPYVWNTTYRVRTTASVDWHTTGIGFGDQNTPSLVDIVQEVVDRGGWSAGNYINFIFIPDSGSTYQLRVWAYEHGSNWEQVYIEYTADQEITGVSHANSSAITAAAVANHAAQGITGVSIANSQLITAALLANDTEQEITGVSHANISVITEAALDLIPQEITGVSLANTSTITAAGLANDAAQGIEGVSHANSGAITEALLSLIPQEITGVDYSNNSAITAALLANDSAQEITGASFANTSAVTAGALANGTPQDITGVSHGNTGAITEALLGQTPQGITGVSVANSGAVTAAGLTNGTPQGIAGASHANASSITEAALTQPPQELIGASHANASAVTAAGLANDSAQNIAGVSLVNTSTITPAALGAAQQAITGVSLVNASAITGAALANDSAQTITGVSLTNTSGITAGSLANGTAQELAGASHENASAITSAALSQQAQQITGVSHENAQVITPAALGQGAAQNIAGISLVNTSAITVGTLAGGTPQSIVGAVVANVSRISAAGVANVIVHYVNGAALGVSEYGAMTLGVLEAGGITAGVSDAGGITTGAAEVGGVTVAVESYGAEVTIA